MKFTITFIKQKLETIASGARSYDMLSITYENADGKPELKKLVSFGEQKEVFEFFKKEQPASGAQFEITAEKGEKYWQWIKVTPASSKETNSTNTTTTTPNPPYTGGKFSMDTQTYIIRQSSIASCIKLFEMTNSGMFAEFTEEAIMEKVFTLADTMVEYVLTGKHTPPKENNEPNC